MSTQVGTRKFLHMRVIKYLRKMWRFWKEMNVSHLILFCSIYVTLRETCPYSELFWSTFSYIRSEFEEILRISPYSVRLQKNVDHNNSEYGHFLRNVKVQVAGKTLAAKRSFSLSLNHSGRHFQVLKNPFYLLSLPF